MERAGVGWRCKRGETCASRPGWGTTARTAPGSATLPANILRSSPHVAGPGGCERVVKAGGGGNPNPAEEGAGARHSAFYLFFIKSSGGGAESLSLGHVIVLKSELRGSRRLGDHYKTQPGERVSATTAAAASPAQDRPGRAAAAATRTAEQTLASLASSWRW